MAYDTQHLYLTAHWTDSREVNEGGQVGIRFDSPASSVNQTMVDNCKAAFATFWTSTGALIPNSYKLQFLRLALIGTDGHYVPGTFSFDGVYNPVQTAPNATVFYPLQVASVATFLTSLPRGQGSHGRIYLPPISAALGSDGRWTTAQADARALAVATMLTSLNAALVPIPGGLPAIASVFSRGTKKGAAGLHSFINGVKVGTRPDVQRRRAKQVLELYGATKAVSH